MNKTEADIRRTKYPYCGLESKCFFWFKYSDVGDSNESVLPDRLFDKITLSVQGSDAAFYYDEEEAYQELFKAIEKL